jgi:WXG100 family type VII secretion target
MSVHLTPDQAQTKINNIEQLRQTAVSKLQAMEGVQSDMTQQNWTGGAATKYVNVSQTQHDDMQQLVTQLNHIVDTAHTHLNSFIHGDNG